MPTMLDIAVILGVVVVAVLVVLLFVINVAMPFAENMRYIRMEMRRAGSDNEYRHWKCEMQQFLTERISLIGWIFAKCI